MKPQDFNRAPWGLHNPAYRTTMRGVDCVDANRFLQGELPGFARRHTETVYVIHSNSFGCIAWDEGRMVVNGLHKMRRMYNLSLGLVQSMKATVSDLRLQLDFVFVKDELDDHPFHEMSLTMEEVVAEGEPWEYDPQEYRDWGKRVPDEVYKLTGLICRKAYVLRPQQVAAFMSKKGWV